MQKFSLHTHTLGFDGQNTEEEMLQKAVSYGWTHLGFSNHFIVHPRIKEAPMYQYALKGGYHNIYSSSFKEVIAKFALHYQKIDDLRQQTDMQILKGMEVDFFASPEWQQGFLQALEILRPDYIIGSAHFIEYKGILYNSHDVKNASVIEQNLLLHRYWQNERAAASSGLFDIMAHLDLMKKVGLGQEERWLEEEQKTIDVIRQSGVKVELNTSYFKFGNEPYPSPRIMRLLAQAEIPVLLSDDAHTAAQLGGHFAKTSEMAKQYGLSLQNEQQSLSFSLLMSRRNNHNKS
ncbi:MAG: histidinol-phosphatase HisJ family protein [Alphaproteobacteria bacterium]|nr:histidinol-phosphatase HisJ family protein [Alphaproteobacteria bacterium]